jgi:hypothetical protein
MEPAQTPLKAKAAPALEAGVNKPQEIETSDVYYKDTEETEEPDADGL